MNRLSGQTDNLTQFLPVKVFLSEFFSTFNLATLCSIPPSTQPYNAWERGLTMPLEHPDDSRFLNEHVRYRSFEKWPIPEVVDPKKLARAGFYYLKTGDKAKCIICHGVLDEWEVGDDPQQEHMRHFPFCPFVQKIIRPQLGLPEDVSFGPDVEYDEVQQNGSLPDQKPYRSDMVTLTSRLESYNSWPEHMRQTPKELAEAGFFYEGKRDRVICFSCGGGLENWEPEEDPLQMHERFYPSCNYLLEVKRTRRKSPDDTVQTAQEQELESSITSPVLNNTEDLPKDSLCNGAVSSSKTKSTTGTSVICKICMNEEVSVLFLPCKHVIACSRCASVARKCPVCDSVIGGTLKTFFS